MPFSLQQELYDDTQYPMPTKDFADRLALPPSGATNRSRATKCREALTVPWKHLLETIESKEPSKGVQWLFILNDIEDSPPYENQVVWHPNRRASQQRCPHGSCCSPHGPLLGLYVIAFLAASFLLREATRNVSHLTWTSAWSV